MTKIQRTLFLVAVTAAFGFALTGCAPKDPEASASPDSATASPNATATKFPPASDEEYKRRYQSNNSGGRR